MRWLMRQPPYAKNPIYTPQRYFISDTSPNLLDTKMHTTDSRW